MIRNSVLGNCMQNIDLGNKDIINFATLKNIHLNIQTHTQLSSWAVARKIIIIIENNKVLLLLQR